MNGISCMVFAFPAFIAGYVWGYLKRGFEVGMEIAEQGIDDA